MATAMDRAPVKRRDSNAPGSRRRGSAAFRCPGSWLKPAPGLATEADVLEAERQQEAALRAGRRRPGGEGAWGYRESLLAGALDRILRAFVVPRNLGLVAGAGRDGSALPGLVRVPDVAFASWDRFPGRQGSRGADSPALFPTWSSRC